MDFFDFFSGFEGSAGYVAVLVTLVVCGLGVPVPEDIILISGGFIAAAAGHGWFSMALVGLAGIMAGDSIIYTLGRRYGLSLARSSLLSRFLTPERLLKVESLFQRHGHKVLVAARFMPGVRAVTFFCAGTMRVPFWKFFLFDGAAALVSAPLWVFLGHRFGPAVVEWAKQFQWLLGLLIVLALAFLLFRRFRSRRAAPVSPAEFAE